MDMQPERTNLSLDIGSKGTREAEGDRGYSQAFHDHDRTALEWR